MQSLRKRKLEKHTMEIEVFLEEIHQKETDGSQQYIQETPGAIDFELLIQLRCFGKDGIVN